MPRNVSLHKAKKAKNDEFYTQYSDIEREINAAVEYGPDVFKDKTVFCRAMTRNGAILLNTSLRTLSVLE